MKVAVTGLWHLGTVAAACLADAGEEVIAIDDADIVSALKQGQPQVNEPGLLDLLKKNVDSDSLGYSSNPQDACDADVVIVAYDTPVDENDRADSDFVRQRILKILPSLKDGAVIIVSSQVPVGFTNELEAHCRVEMPSKQIYFVCSPENLRLGRAIQCFKQPGRIVVGTTSEVGLQRVKELYGRFTDNFVCMSATSAEMTKHALNAYLGLSIAFINEIASLCETVGADARDVERGLKSEERIGDKAPLSPGAAFAGGTLARDVSYLVDYGQTNDCPTPLLAAIKVSNQEHKRWALRRLQQELGDLSGQIIAVLGLTYKPGTDTLRRSSSLELCLSLSEAGAIVRAHDPVVKSLPRDVSRSIELKESAREAFQGAGAVVLATPWPEYRAITAADLGLMKNPLFLDAGAFLRSALDGVGNVKYVSVGKKL